MSIANIFKGWIGEKAVQFGIWLKLDKNTYRRYHGLILQTENGTTQIDHVLLSIYGIFVVETKNYGGWIYGGETQREWTQVFFDKKNKFQNPLHQNYKHTKALASHLNVAHNKIHSIVMFIGDAELKTEFPPNVLTGGLAAYIKNFKEVVFDESEIKKMQKYWRQRKTGKIY